MSREFYGRGGGASRESLTVILEAVDLRTAAFPLSEIHIMETQHRGDKPSARRLVDFMLRLSQGLFIAPAAKITRWELRNAVAKYIGRPGIFGYPQVFGYGVTFGFGQDGESTATLPGNRGIESLGLLWKVYTRFGLRRTLHGMVEWPGHQLLKQRGRKVARGLLHDRSVWANYDKNTRRRARFVLEMLAATERQELPGFYLSEYVYVSPNPPKDVLGDSP